MFGSQLKQFHNKEFLFHDAGQGVRIENGIYELITLLDLAIKDINNQKSILLEKIIRAEKDTNTLSLIIFEFLEEFSDTTAKQTRDRVEFCRAIIFRSLHIDLVHEIARDEYDQEKIKSILNRVKEMVGFLLQELGKLKEYVVLPKNKKGMVTLYHATSSDEEFNLVRDFWRKGARSNLSEGHGQGEGFYVWTKFDYAVKHLRFISGSITKGKIPIIVAINTFLDMREWDLDAETHFNLIAPFLFERLDLFKKIPDDVIVINGKPLLISKCSKSPFAKAIVFEFGGLHKGSYCLPINEEQPSIYEGKFAGKIFTALQRFFPKETLDFENNLIANHFDKITALKYVGNHPFSVSSILILRDETFVPAEQVISDLGEKY